MPSPSTHRSGGRSSSAVEDSSIIDGAHRPLGVDTNTRHGRPDLRLKTYHPRVTSTALPQRLRAAGRVTAFASLGLVIVALSALCWVGVRGALAYQHLAQIQAEAPGLLSNASESASDAVPEVARLASHAQSASELTSDPIWRMCERAPWLGPQLAAFSTVAASSDQLFAQAILPLLAAADGLSPETLKPINGRINAEPLRVLAGPSAQAATVARHSADSVTDIDRAPLIGRVSRAVEQADSVFTKAANTIDALSRTTQLLPDMLGGNGQRKYLVLVQNNAEWRSLGGITGTTILMSTDEGAVELSSTDSATSLLRRLDGPFAHLSDEVQAIWQNRPATFPHNLTQIPDFAVDGGLAQSMYFRATGIQVDGVIALDPVALSYLLEATGPVATPQDGALTSKNAASLLMNEVYLRYPNPEDQDAFFAAATGGVFDAILQGRGSFNSFITALGRASGEHRLLMWSAEPGEQKVLEGTALAGVLPSSDDRAVRFGVYLNDGAGSKMSYYVEPTSSIAWEDCGAAGRVAEKRITLSLNLTNTAPADAASSLPWYITGGGVYAVPPGTARVVTNLVIPEGFDVAAVDASDGASFSRGTFEGRQVLTYSTDLAPQGSSTATISVAGRSSSTYAEAIVTPTADSDLDPVVRVGCDSRQSALVGLN